MLVDLSSDGVGNHPQRVYLQDWSREGTLIPHLHYNISTSLLRIQQNARDHHVFPDYLSR